MKTDQARTHRSQAHGGLESIKRPASVCADNARVNTVPSVQSEYKKCVSLVELWKFGSCGTGLDERKGRKAESGWTIAVG